MRLEMNPNAQIDRLFLESIVEQYGLVVEELHASNRELKSILDHAGNGARMHVPESLVPTPRPLPADVSLAQLRSELLRLQDQCRDAVREAVALRQRARETPRMPAAATKPASNGKLLSRREREVLTLM